MDGMISIEDDVYGPPGEERPRDREERDPRKRKRQSSENNGHHHQVNKVPLANEPAPPGEYGSFRSDSRNSDIYPPGESGSGAGGGGNRSPQPPKARSQSKRNSYENDNWAQRAEAFIHKVNDQPPKEKLHSMLNTIGVNLTGTNTSASAAVPGLAYPPVPPQPPQAYTAAPGTYHPMGAYPYQPPYPPPIQMASYPLHRSTTRNEDERRRPSAGYGDQELSSDRSLTDRRRRSSPCSSRGHRSRSPLRHVGTSPYGKRSPLRGSSIPHQERSPSAYYRRSRGFPSPSCRSRMGPSPLKNQKSPSPLVSWRNPSPYRNSKSPSSFGHRGNHSLSGYRINPSSYSSLLSYKKGSPSPSRKQINPTLLRNCTSSPPLRNSKNPLSFSHRRRPSPRISPSPYRKRSPSPYRSPLSYRRGSPSPFKRWSPSQRFKRTPSPPQILEDPLTELYEELRNQERLRQEIEEERRKIFLDEVDPPEPSSVLNSMNPLFNEMSVVQQQQQRQPEGWTYRQTSVESKDENHAEEKLRPGNYLIAVWDILTRNDEQRSSNLIFQLGVFLPHGVEFQECILPDEWNEIKNPESFPIVIMKDQYYVQVPTSRELFHVVSTKTALEDFLSVLEKGVQSVRPKYDGVLLLSHEQESIPVLLKLIKKNQLWPRFQSVVEGLGDLCSYLAQCHSQKFLNGNNGDLDLSLNRVHRQILLERLPPGLSSEVNAKAIYQILVKLLNSHPTYANFMKRFFSPLKSKLMERLANYRSLQERLELYLPMKRYIAEELHNQKVELVIVGVYAPMTEEEKLEDLSEPLQVATSMCKLLISCGFDFDQLLELYMTKGLVDLELKIRTAFLEKMIGQERRVINQTIHTTRLALQFFRRYGHLSLDELSQSAREAERLENLPSPEDRESSKLASDSDLYKRNFLAYKRAAQFFTKYLMNSSRNPSEDIKTTVDMWINCLLQADLSHEFLQRCYLQDKMKHKSRLQFRRHLTMLLQSKYCIHGPPNYSLSVFVDLLIKYCGSTCKKYIPSLSSEGSTFAVGWTHSSQRPSSPKLSSPPPKSEYLFNASTLEQLEAYEAKLFIFCSEALNRNGRSHYFSVETIRRYFVKKLIPLCEPGARQAELAERLAECVKKLLAAMGFNHYKMKEAFDKSVSYLVSFISNNPKISELPPGMSKSLFLEIIVSYFKSDAFTTIARKQWRAKGETVALGGSS